MSFLSAMLSFVSAMLLFQYLENSHQGHMLLVWSRRVRPTQVIVTDYTRVKHSLASQNVNQHYANEQGVSVSKLSYFVVVCAVFIRIGDP